MKMYVCIAVFLMLIGSYCLGNEVSILESVEISGDDTTRDIVYKAAHVTPSERQLRWQENEFIAFMCYGPNAHTGREWGTGREDPSIVNPTEFDADEVVGLCKEFGMTMIIFLAKHHDGFCVWPTETTDHNISKSPWKEGKGDMLKDMAEACRKHGIELSMYLSPWDMNQQHKGTFDSPVYREVFREQLRELLTNYGAVGDVWFDGAHAPGCHGKPYNAEWFDWLGYYKMIRTLQPDATISVMGPDVRWCGNEAGRSRKSEWSVLPFKDDLSRNPFKMMDWDKRAHDLGSRAKLKNARSLAWYPAQVNTSIRPGWFWRASEDNRIKSLDHLLHIYLGAVGGNGQFLLNLPLDDRGKIHENDVKRMRELRKVLDMTFNVNLAKGAKGKASRSLIGHGPENILDGNKLTYWTVEDGQETASVELQLPKIETFNLVELQEQIREGQRVEEFAVDAMVNGKWKELGKSTTIGYKKYLSVPDTTTDKVRVRILASRVCPTLSNFGLFYKPKMLNAPGITKNKRGQIVLSTEEPSIKIRYTLDGSVPDLDSAIYTAPLDLPNGGNICAKAFAGDSQTVIPFGNPVSRMELGISSGKWKIHSVDSEETSGRESGAAINAIDGDPETFWHTQWVNSQPGQPHSIAIDLGEATDISGFTYLPRQDSSIGGVIDTYEFYVSNDGIHWGQPATKGRFDNIENNPIQQSVKLKKTVPGRYVKLVSISGVKNQAFAGAAEIGITGRPAKEG